MAKIPKLNLIKTSGLIVALLATIWIGFWIALQLISKFNIPVTIHSQSMPNKIGSMNEEPVSIPADYLFFPVIYEGESAWESKNNSPVRTFESVIRNFSIYLHWPDLKPKENEASYLSSQKEVGASNWMMVSLEAESSVKKKIT